MIIQNKLWTFVGDACIVKMLKQLHKLSKLIIYKMKYNERIHMAEDYDKNLNDIIAQQSKIDCGVDNLKQCLRREIFIDQNKETSKDLIKILDDQINTINELLKLMQSPTVSNCFQNQ